MRVGQNFAKALTCWGIVVVLCLSPAAIAYAKSNTLSDSDADTMERLWEALYSATNEVIEAAKTASSNPGLQRCLLQLHEESTSVVQAAAALRTFTQLASVMLNTMDELMVLEAMQTWFNALSQREVPITRRRLNEAMTSRQCAGFALVASKGQAILNVLSQLSEHMASMQSRAARAIPAR